MHVKEEVIFDELAKAVVSDVGDQSQNNREFFTKKNIITKEDRSRKTLIEEKVIALILKNPDHISLIEPGHAVLFSQKVQQF